VLDRRTHNDVGPDGAGVGPVVIIDAMVEEITPAIRTTYPKASVTTTKRTVLIDVHEPIGDDDPSVDLIVGLTQVIPLNRV
jgi:hypothetical protein